MLFHLFFSSDYEYFHIHPKILCLKAPDSENFAASCVHHTSTLPGQQSWHFMQDLSNLCVAVVLVLSKEILSVKF